jgi:hypothetical protein
MKGFWIDFTLFPITDRHFLFTKIPLQFMIVGAVFFEVVDRASGSLQPLQAFFLAEGEIANLERENDSLQRIERRIVLSLPKSTYPLYARYA